MSAVHARCDAVSALCAAEIAALASLLDRHFLGVQPAQVAADLREKTQIVRLFAGTVLVGFSSFAYARTAWRGVDIGAVWSGDTIVDPEHWHAGVLPLAWLRGVRHAHAATGGGSLAWCLICSGLRTFRFLPTFLTHYAPGRDADGELLALRDHLARQRYGDRYREGIVRLAAPQVLRAHLDPAPDRLRGDPACAAFLRENPGHAAGDELACAAWLHDDTMTRAGRALWARSTPHLPMAGAA